MDQKTQFPSRRTIGLIVGAAMGLVYGLVSTYINLVFIRGIPLYNDALSNLNQIFWSILAGAIMGFVVNWPEAAFLGVLVASLLGSVTIFIGTLIKSLQAQGSYGLLLVTFFYFILPLTALFVPLTALVRWVAGYIHQAADKKWWNWHYLRIYIGLFLLTVIVGSFAMYSSEAQAHLRTMNAQIIKVQSSHFENIPWAFEEISSIVANASSDYALEWTDDLDRFPYSLQGEDDSSGLALQAVFAYFSSGETVVCLFTGDSTIYLCAPGR
jgi:hypothetical protein